MFNISFFQILILLILIFLLFGDSKMLYSNLRELKTFLSHLMKKKS